MRNCRSSLQLPFKRSPRIGFGWGNTASRLFWLMIPSLFPFRRRFFSPLWCPTLKHAPCLSLVMDFRHEPSRSQSESIFQELLQMLRRGESPFELWPWGTIPLYLAGGSFCGRNLFESRGWHQRTETWEHFFKFLRKCGKTALLLQSTSQLLKLSNHNSLPLPACQKGSLSRMEWEAAMEDKVNLESWTQQRRIKMGVCVVAGGGSNFENTTPGRHWLISTHSSLIFWPFLPLMMPATSLLFIASW